MNNSTGRPESERLMWKRFDSFPRPIRDALNNADFNWHTMPVKKLFEQTLNKTLNLELTIAIIIKFIKNWDMQERKPPG